MYGIIEIGGTVVKNKAEGIREATRLCVMNDPNQNNGFRANVMRYDDPDIIWFSVGFGDCDASNYVKLDPRKTTEFYEKLDNSREKIHAQINA